MSNISIVVGSKNPVKVEAAREAISAFFPESDIDCMGVDAPSGVAEQPMGEEETRVGAENRVRHCQAHYQADFFVAVEGGVAAFPEGPATFAYVVIASEKQCSVSRSASLPLPRDVYAQLQAGGELGPIMDALFATKHTKQKIGAINFLTQNKATRKGAYVQALTMAMAPFLFPALYHQQ